MLYNTRVLAKQNTWIFFSFNDSRGQWTLGREGLLDALGWSLSRPFDESLLLWHWQLAHGLLLAPHGQDS